MLFGSIAQQVVALKVPVLLVRPVAGGGGPLLSGKPFLVPLDGSEVREQALPVAAELASQCGVRVELLMVVPTLGTLSGVENSARLLLPATTQEILDQEREDAVEYLNGVVSRMGGGSVEVRGRIRCGALAEVVMKEAARLDVDLIVMGTVAKTGLDAFWSASVTPVISNRTHLPLLLLPPAPNTQASPL